jgi:A/G-specific adenine glycosylase
MALFPTVGALAEADETAVLRAWEGLGYYARARNLHRAAREVTARFGGKLPEQLEDFRALPGVGPYTAAAVLSLAFGRDLAVVDGNVRRVLARLTALPSDPRRRPQAASLEALACALLPPGTAALHNQAVMELGATLCSPRSPSCTACPLRGPCRAAVSGAPGEYPLRAPRKAVPHYRVCLGLVFRQGSIFIDRRPYEGLLGGLWEFPGGKVEKGESPEQALHRELGEEFGLRVEPEGTLPPVRHAYSHFRVTLHPYLCRFLDMDPGRCAEGAREWLWVDPAERPRYPMPRANRKVLEHLARR